MCLKLLEIPPCVKYIYVMTLSQANNHCKALGMISFDHTLSLIHISLSRFCSRNQRKRHSARSPNRTSWSKCTADVDRYTGQFRWSTCRLKFFSWLLDHVIYLKLRNVLLLLQAELLHKIHSIWSLVKIYTDNVFMVKTFAV